MTRSCALMAVYNEADVVREAVTKLIAQGVDVYLVDNASTDGTAGRVADLVGRGLVDIETVRFLEDGREVYDWTALLRQKEQLSRRLGYDWYLHVDADEIRHAPWPGVSLAEGIARVDAAGYQLINFKLFNFRLTEATVVGAEVESSMTLYSGSERFNQRQVKAWKSHPEADLASLGGHHVRWPGARVFPTRFIHKHYPVRSLEHGRRKILAERKARFSKAEKARGWHVQYDHLADIDPKDVYWDPALLTGFDFERESHALFVESSGVLAGALADAADGPLDESSLVARWAARLAREGVAPAHVQQLIGVANGLVQVLAQQDPPPIAAAPADARALARLIGSFACMRFLAGDPALYGRLPALQFR
jgi:hypothetical protein